MLALKRLPEKHTLIKLAAQTNKRTQITRNAWQSLAYSPIGAIVSPPSEYL